VANAILSVYTARTAGSYATRKGSSITWKYDDADPEFGAMQAKELHHQLEQVRRAAVRRCGGHCAFGGAQCVWSATGD